MANNFDLKIAQSLFDSNDAFPVDFDLAWKWLGYTRKETALKNLLSDQFDEGIDFTASPLGEPSMTGFQPATPQTKYFLTVDCFKTLGMLAKTKFGKQIRQYFLECEKAIKDVYAGLTPTEILLKQCERLVAVEKQQIAMEAALVQLQAEKIEQMAVVMEAQTLAIESLKQSTANSAEIHRMSDHSGLMFSVMGFANLIKFGSLPLDRAAQIGRTATKICKAHEMPIGKTSDPRFGEVNTYPKEVLIALFADGGN